MYIRIILTERYLNGKRCISDDSGIEIQYVLSDDIKTEGPQGKVVYIGAEKEIMLDGLRIRTLRSTDEGVAFFVYLRDKVIYHAGDLNWWHWEEEEEDYNSTMQRRYQREIGKLEGERIDVAFLPLDPRQKDQYCWGFVIRIQNARFRCICGSSMIFAGNYWRIRCRSLTEIR